MQKQTFIRKDFNEPVLARTYDFSHDSTWSDLDKTRKQREEMLKHLSGPLADPDSGEMIFPAQFKVTPVITIILLR